MRLITIKGRKYSNFNFMVSWYWNSDVKFRFRYKKGKEYCKRGGLMLDILMLHIKLCRR